MGLSDEFRALTRRLDPPLWVVTATDGVRPGGLVATFVTPASIVDAMPRVLVGIARQHRTWELIEAVGAFALHLPGEQNLDWVDRFGLESGRSVDKFAGLSYRAGVSGSPILDTASGWMDCRVEASLDTGDRTVYLAEVLDARAPDAPAVSVGAWVDRLAPDRLARLVEQRARDASVDAGLILAWRASRTSG